VGTDPVTKFVKDTAKTAAGIPEAIFTDTEETKFKSTKPTPQPQQQAPQPQQQAPQPEQPTIGPSRQYYSEPGGPMPQDGSVNPFIGVKPIDGTYYMRGVPQKAQGNTLPMQAAVNSLRFG
jgi:hypothetical protein